MSNISMRGRTYQIFFIYISSLYTSEHWFVGSQRTNQESVTTIGLAKKYLHGNNTKIDGGKMAATVAVATTIFGIGMRALTNELSSREINSPHKYGISSVPETTNDVAVFGMHRGSMQSNESNQRASTNLHQIYEGHEPSDSESDAGSMTDDLDGDNDHLLQNMPGTGSAGQPSSSSTMETIVLVMESTNNNEDNMQDNGIHTQGKKRTTDIILTNKRGRTKIYAGIGCCFLVLGVVATALILKYTIINKETLVEKLYGHNYSISIPTTKIIDKVTETETTEQATETTEQATEKTERATETTEQATETTEQATETTEKTAEDATDDKISLTSDICKQYGDIPSVCLGLRSIASSNCITSMIGCMYQNRQPDGDITVPTACEHTVNKTNIREHFYGEFTTRLNKAIQSAQNISSLDCAAAFNGFNKTIQEMLNRYNCGPNDVFENKVLQRSLELCDAFKENKASIYDMCLAQKQIVFVRRVLNDWPVDVTGSMRSDWQRRFINCTEHYHRDYFTKYLSPEKHWG